MSIRKKKVRSVIMTVRGALSVLLRCICPILSLNGRIYIRIKINLTCGRVRPSFSHGNHIHRSPHHGFFDDARPYIATHAQIQTFTQTPIIPAKRKAGGSGGNAKLVDFAVFTNH